MLRLPAMPFLKAGIASGRRKHLTQNSGSGEVTGLGSHLRLSLPALGLSKVQEKCFSANMAGALRPPGSLAGVQDKFHMSILPCGPPETVMAVLPPIQGSPSPSTRAVRASDSRVTKTPRQERGSASLSPVGRQAKHMSCPSRLSSSSSR